MTKMRERTFEQLSKSEKIASVMFPDQVDEQRRKSKAKIALAEKKKAPFRQSLLSDKDRKEVSPLGGVAKSGARK